MTEMQKLEMRPANCRKCGHKLPAYSILSVCDQQMLLDVDGGVIYELILECHYCTERFHWHTNSRELHRHTRDLRKMLDNAAATVREEIAGTEGEAQVP